MRRIAFLVAAVVLFVVSCSGGDTTDDVGDDEGGGGDRTSSGSDLADPCSLIDRATLDSYFDEAVEPEPSGSGPFLTCTWSDSSANSILVSVATSDSVNRPENCPDCIDLDFGDDGYATSVPLQSTAEFVIGGSWYSVTTTGLGDDVDSIAALGRQVFEEVS